MEKKTEDEYSRLARPAGEASFPKAGSRVIFCDSVPAVKDTGDDGNEAEYLRHAHPAPENLGRQPPEFGNESLDAIKDQHPAQHQPRRLDSFAQPPQDEKKGERKQGFINGGRMNRHLRRHQAVGKSHAPRQIRGRAIVAIAG